MTPDAGMTVGSDAAPTPRGPVHGEADTAWLMDEGTLLLVGSAMGRLPAAGNIAPRAGATIGQARCHCWPLGAGSGEGGKVDGFVALVTLENVATLRPDHIEIAVQQGVGGVLTIQRIQLDQQSAVRRLASIAPGALPGIFEFLSHALAEANGMPDPAGRAERVRSFLAALLRESSKSDGFVEIIGRAEDGGLLVQGWSFHLGAGTHDLLVETDRPLRQHGAVGTFERADLPPSAKGVMCYLRGQDGFAAEAVQRIHYRTADGFHHLNTVENRRHLAPAECVPHLRDMLPRLASDIDTKRKFKRACRPRFEGVETVSGFGKPVRAAIDLAVAIPEAGIFVSGWLLDPMRLVERVILKGTDGSYNRVDDVWGRLWRPDVSDGYRNDPVTGPAVQAAPATAQRHGFAVFVPRPNVARMAATYWLEIVLADESCAFLPFQPADAAQEGIADRLLTCLDPRDAAVRQIVERHLAPASIAVMSRAGRQGDAGEVVPIGAKRPGDETPRLSIVIPVGGGAEDLDINLACLAGEPAATMSELVIVAAGTGDASLAARVDRYARFYGFSGRLVLAQQAMGKHHALERGAALAEGEALLFLSPDVLPRGAGWLGAMVRSFRSSDRAGLVSPTLLYEDDSIRFAGLPLAEVTPEAPMPNGPGRYAGYPRHWIKGGEPVEVLAGSSECCLMPRRLFQRIGGFARDLASGAHQDVELGLRLRAAGRRCIWLPTVALYAIDPAARSTLPPHGAEIARMVDEWSFARTWERQRDRQGAMPKSEAAE